MNLAVSITIIILLTIAGISFTYSLQLFRMLTKIQKRLSDRVFYWLIGDEEQMAYDIYGQKLASGHCEVHPWVGESYPCSLCYAESKPKYDPIQKYIERAEAEHYAEMERAHYEEMVRQNNLLYRMLCYVALTVSRLNERLQKYKEKMFNNIMQITSKQEDI